MGSKKNQNSILKFSYDFIQDFINYIQQYH